MNVLILWQGVSGYFDACVRALAQHDDVADVFVAYERAPQDAPFAGPMFSSASGHYAWTGRPDYDELVGAIGDFVPDLVLVSSFHLSAYRKFVRPLRGRAVRVLCMDNQWLEKPKQWLGRVSSRIYLHPYFDTVFVPGDRQASFARHLGYRQSRIMYGLYSADVQKFQRAEHPAGEGFLFVGRLVPDKGIESLLEAYSMYRQRRPDGWSLTIVGTGPLATRCQGQSGVVLEGFKQPDELPALMWRHGCLVMPSLFEPWGVALHEAASAGLALICSDAVGAGSAFVQDGYNGYVVPAGRADHLADAMLSIGRDGTDSERKRMADRSRQLAERITPGRWADYVVQTAPRLSDVQGRTKR